MTGPGGAPPAPPRPPLPGAALALTLLAALVPAQETPGTLRVRVLDPAGRPLRAGTLLAARSPLASFPLLQRLVRLPATLTRGSIRGGRGLVSLPAGLATALQVSAPGGLAPWSGPWFAGSLARLQLGDPGTVAVVVRAGGRKGPVHVRFTVAPPAGTGMAIRLDQAGRLGQPLTFPPCRSGQARVIAWGPGLAPGRRALTVTAGGETRVEVTLQPGRKRPVTLRTAAGQPPPPGATIHLDGLPLPWVRPDGEGRFTLACLPAGPALHRVAAHHPDHAPAVAWHDGAAARPGALALQLRAPLRLVGTLSTRAGTPAAGVRVVVTGAWTGREREEPWARTGITEADGRLTLQVPRTDLPAALILMGAAGPEGMVMTPALEAKAKEVALPPLVLPAGNAVRGRLEGLEAAETGRARVELRPAEAGPLRLETLVRRVPVDRRGAFTFLGAGLGWYDLQVRVPGRVGISRRVQVGREPCTLTLRPRRGLTVAGRVLLPDGRGAAGAEVVFQPLAADTLPVVILSGPDGRFEARGVPAEPCRVSAVLEWQGRAWSARVPFPGNRSSSLEIRLFREP